MTRTRQLSLEETFTQDERIALCHSRIPERRVITGFLDSNLIAPLMCWSPVPEKYQRTAHDSFSVWGLEAQHPKYLPEVLKPFVYVERQHGKVTGLGLREGAFKKKSAEVDRT